jgi:hypothetical protein
LLAYSSYYFFARIATEAPITTTSRTTAKIGIQFFGLSYLGGSGAPGCLAIISGFASRAME